MELYHLLNRGVEKRNVFVEEADYVRFVHDMYIFNNLAPVDPNHRFKKIKNHRKRNLLVDIHAFCLMPNHYHMLVSEKNDNGISNFMRKLNMGYAKYFNEKYSRTGVLWQGIFRKIQVKRDAHFLYIPYYIHLNPLDLTVPKWRDGAVQNPGKAIDLLLRYRWSSFMDYYGIENFPSLTNRVLLSDILGSQEDQKQVIKEIISNPTVAEHSKALES